MDRNILKPLLYSELLHKNCTDFIHQEKVSTLCYLGYPLPLQMNFFHHDSKRINKNPCHQVRLEPQIASEW